MTEKSMVAGMMSNAQLVALLIGVDEQTGASIVADGLRSIPEIRARKGSGLSEHRVAKLHAALELGTRLATEGRPSRPQFRTPADTGRYLLPRYAAKPVEMFGLLSVDIRHRLKREDVISVGCLSSSLVHPREVFKAALDARAAAVILFHNHPSGDPEPSAEDIALTRRLSSVGTLMGMEVLDHVVVGAGRYVSFKERGLL